MEHMHVVGDELLEAWCEAWNDGPRLLPRSADDLRHEAATLGLCERFALGAPQRPDAVGALRRHFAFRQATRLALDLRVRPDRRGRGLGGSLLVQLLARAGALGADVIRAYAPEDDGAWRALALRFDLHEVECDQYFLLEIDHATIAVGAGTAVSTLASEPADAEHDAWQLEQALHSALEAPGCGPATVLVSRTPRGELAGICALRICSADPATAYHAFTGVAATARGQGHGLALKLAAIARARELGARRMVADTSPQNSAMLALNERLGYRAVLAVRNLEGSP
jgi:RimJ/RimL family protein N-acetyltransferase